MKSPIGIAIAMLVMCVPARAQEYGPWSPPVTLGPTVNSSSDDMHPTLSKDGLTLIFSSTRSGGAGGLDLWMSQRDSADSPWQTPQNISMLNGPFDDHAANLTSNGHWVFFYSTRPGGCSGGGRQELWAAHRRNKRDDFGWDAPFNLGCTLNLAGADAGAPTFWENDSGGVLNLYFARNLTPANANGFDIYLSTCAADITSCNRGQLWEPPVLASELNSSGRDTRTAIRSRDGLEIVVTSNRAGTVGNLDLWVATRSSTEDAFSTPVNLNVENQDKCVESGIDPCPVLNTTANDGAAALSWDNETMIFYSNRAGGLGGNDLYMSTRKKVHRQ